MDNLLDRLQRALGDAYVVERELAAGGMSRIFVATERSLNRQVVIKVLTPDAAGTVSEERFKREAGLLGRLQHPHIVPLLGFGSHEGLLWFSMPYVRGETVRERLAREGPLPVDEAVSLLREVADALAYAHRSGVIHRDIKPSNILLSDGHAVLGDFGIAGSGTATHGLTSTGTAVGTIGYMAPEQLVGEGAVDGRADIYALGVVGYELLTGRSPFVTASGGYPGAPQLRGRPTSPEKARPGIPAVVARALLRAMEQDPEQRFAGAAEFRQALGASSKWLTARRATAAAVVLAIGVVAAVAMRSRTRSDPDRNLIAVAPFDVQRADLQLWREGMVDVLSRNLDGMGDLRTVAPTTVLRAWHGGRSDAASAQLLGVGTKARHVVVGTLQAAGDSALANAAVYDVVTGAKLGDIEARDLLDRIDRVADSLTVRMVRLLSGGVTAGAPGRPFGTRSLAALKEYLQGEQAFRRALWDTADAHFARAVEIDTSFALAYRRRGNTWEWGALYQTNFRDDPMPLYGAASAHARGLSPHDSLLILVDSLELAIHFDLKDPDADLTRILAAARALTEQFSGDGEGWMLYAGLLYEFAGPRTGYPTPARILAAADRAIAADSGLAFAYLFLGIAVENRDTARRRAYLDAAGRWAPTGAIGSQLKLSAWLLDPRRTSADCRALVDTIGDPASLLTAVFFTFHGAALVSDSTAANCVAAAGALPRERRAKFNPGILDIRSIAADILRARGELARAAQLDADWSHDYSIVDAAALAMAGLMGADSVHARSRAALIDSSRIDEFRREQLAPFWAWRRDTASLAEAARALRRVGRRGPVGGSEARIAGVTKVYAGYTALARGDTAGAIRILESAPYIDGPLSQAVWVGTLARLYEQRGRLREAYTILAAHNPAPARRADGMLAQLQLGRVAERVGERESAARAYGFVNDAWRHADTPFKALRQEAMDGVRRNGGDVGGRALR